MTELYMRRIIFIFALIFSWAGLTAQDVTREDAYDASIRFMENYFPGGIRVVKEIIPQEKDKQVLLYVIDLAPGGWLLVSADKRTEPVLGFSYIGEYVRSDPNPNNPEYYWISSYEKQISEIKREPYLKDHPGWSENYYSTTLKSASAAPVSVYPLITVTWNQGSGWNRYCPEDAEGPGGHVYVGCVAVAMAQAMSAYNSPATGTGYKAYTNSPYGTLTANFGETSYRWDMMPVAQSDTNNALLLYHCAVSVEMDFGPDGSGTQTTYASGALKNYFGYSNNISYKRRSSYEANWKEMLTAELVAGRPIIYKGDADDGLPGHAWNIDGVVNENYFHVNWGWGGSNNGYFLIDNLKVDNNDFTKNQAAIFHIQPLYYPTGISLSNYIVPEDDLPGSFVGKVSVIDEATDNQYIINLISDSTLVGDEWVYDYYIENDSLKTGRTFPAGEILKDTIGFHVTDLFGNILDNEVYLTFETTSANTAVIDYKRVSAFIIYPNPAGDYISIADDNSHPLDHIKLYNLSGQIVRYVSASEIGGGFSVSGIRSGIYILEATYNDGYVVRKKLIKK
jgi:hypothetical protein